MTPTDNYNLLIEKINVFIRKYHYNNFLRGLLILAAGLFSAYVSITLLEYFGNFNILLRTFLFYFFILLNLGLFVGLVLPPILARFKLGKTITHDEAAEIIGRHFNDVHDKLLNTLQLKKQAAQNVQYRELIEASINQKIDELRPVSFPSAINIQENSKYLKWVVPPAALICIIAFAAPSVLTESTKRLIHHNEYFAPVAPFNFVLLNNTLSVVQGQNYKLDIKLTGDKIPADVYVETANSTFKLNKENLSRFHYLFTNLQRNTTFILSANGFKSRPYELRVHLKPLLLHFDALLSYPAYLNKRNEMVDNAGDLTLPAGTIVNWSFHTQNASALSFSFAGNNTFITPTGTDLFKHHERIVKSTTYTINPVNNQVKLSDSATYRISVIADEPPSIEVIKKADSVSIKALYFEGRIRDDYGFSSLTFHYKTKEKGAVHSVVKPIKADLSSTEGTFFYYWDLKQLEIKQGTTVSYYFEVTDNDGVTGPKRSRTPELSLNIPDAAGLAEQLNAGSQAVKDKMNSAVKLAGQLERSAQKLNQALLEKSSLSFDEKKQVEELLQKRKDLDDLVKEVQADNKKNLYNRQETQQQSEELTDLQKQIEDLINNVLDEKTKEMLQKLQHLLQENQKDGTRSQLSTMQKDNKSLKKELNRILDLYKKLDFEQRLNQELSRLNQLADDQKNLAGETQKAGNKDNADLQKKQQRVNDQFDAVKKSLDDLQQENEKTGNNQDFKIQTEEQKSIEKQLKQSSEDLKQNNRQQASKSQQQAAKQMKQLAENMQQNDNEERETESALDTRQLRELIKSLVNSSFIQEKLMQSLHNTNLTDPSYILLAQKQKDIKDNLKTAEDSLYSLSRRIPQIQSTVNKEIEGINDQITKALNNLGDRKTDEANKNQQFAMASMNNLALMLSEALEQLQKQKSKSGKGKGKQPSLSQLSKMQQQLNQNMQKARDQIQKTGNPQQSQNGQQGLSEQFAKMAREQQFIRQSLQHINKDNNKDGSSKPGNLDIISKQMEQTESDLVNKKITNEALNRQQQIQTRLLEAEKAEQEREQDEKRESRAANNLPPGYIKALQDYSQKRAKQTEHIKTVPAALNLYYKQKTKLYFDQLNGK
jgi:hypothetical protein